MILNHWKEYTPKTRLAVALCFSAIALTEEARADLVTLPNVHLQTITTYSSLGDVVFQPKSATGQNIISFANGDQAVITAGLDPSPYMLASASVTQRGDTMSALGSIDYWFQIVGPAGIQVPVNITASGAVSYGSISDNYATLAFNGDGTVLGSACSGPSLISCPGGINSEASFSVSVLRTLTSDTTYGLSLNLGVYANTLAGDGTRTSDFSSGFIDPVITIDRAFSNEFSLVFSPGVGNSPLSAAAVPEPASLAIFGTALAGFGLLRRGPSQERVKKSDMPK